MPLYLAARTKLMKGEIDLAGDDIKVQLLTSAYVYDVDHEFRDDITVGVIGVAVAMPGTEVVDGKLSITGSVTFPDVPALGVVSQCILFKDSGAPATSDLIGHVVAEMGVAANNGDILLAWDDNIVIEL